MNVTVRRFAFRHFDRRDAYRSRSMMRIEFPGKRTDLSSKYLPRRRGRSLVSLPVPSYVDCQGVPARKLPSSMPTRMAFLNISQSDDDDRGAIHRSRITNHGVPLGHGILVRRKRHTDKHRLAKDVRRLLSIARPRRNPRVSHGRRWSGGCCLL
jgi:hypothetical protein